MPDPDHTCAIVKSVEITEQELNVTDRELFEKFLDYLLQETRDEVLQAHVDRHG